jgi:hypothetical protein
VGKLRVHSNFRAKTSLRATRETIFDAPRAEKPRYK